MLGCFAGGLLLISLRSPVDDLPFRASMAEAVSVAKRARKTILYADDQGTWGLADSRLAAFLADPKAKVRMGRYVLIHTRRGYLPASRDRSLELDPEVPSLLWLDENGVELQRSMARIGVSRFLLVSGYAEAALARRRAMPRPGTLEHALDRLDAGNPNPALEAVRQLKRSASERARIALALAESSVSRSRVHSARAWLREAQATGLPKELLGRSFLAYASLNSMGGELGKAVTDLEQALKLPLEKAEKDYAVAALTRLRNRIGATFASR